MKKTLRMMGLCALVALAATACKKEAQTTSSFKATLTQPTSDAKTHLGSDSYLYWNEGDTIKVFDAEGNASIFFTTENDVTSATFTGTDPIEVEGNYTAYYPAANAVKEGDEIRLTLPATQNYAHATFGNATYPMAAGYNATDGFTFGSDCGLLALQVQGTGNIGSIELTGKNSENLAGQLRYDLNGTYQGLTNAQTKVTLNCGNLSLDPTNATTFYFVVPAGVFNGGFTAVLKNGDTELYTLETSNNNAIAKETIMVMPVVTVEAIGVTTGNPSDLGSQYATISGSYIAPLGMSVTEVGFYYGTDTTSMTSVSVTVNTSFSYYFDNNLEMGTTYYYQAYAKNGVNEYIGELKNFTTLAPPAVATAPTGHEEPTVTANTAECYGALESLTDIMEYGICWSTENFNFSKDAQLNYVQSDNWNSVNGVFSASIPVTGGCTYYYCAYARNMIGTGYGEVKSFTTNVNPYAVPLTFEARVAGASVELNNTSGINLEYSTDGVNWNTYDAAVTLTNAGDMVSFRGNNTNFNQNSSVHTFTCTGNCYIYGNIMSLLHAEEYATNYTLPEYAFYRLFSNNNRVDIHPDKELVLPATTLAPNCYYYMFYGCSSLTTVPALPATMLAEKCYSYMFRNCTSLQTVPSDLLPATTLANECYSNMFYGCLSLTTVPALPATMLAEKCYYYMFRNCTSLQTVPSDLLPATTLANECYSCMFYGCTSLTTAPTLPATTLAPNCYASMFRGCSSLQTAPELLPATTLAPNCYYYMFYDCTSLTTVPALPATMLANSCYANMFQDCKGLQTVPSDLLPATTLANECYSCMFYGCTSLTTAPTLPATTLAAECYYRMFENCSHLNSITCLATSFGSNSTMYWVSGVASSGTFTKAAGASWTTGNHGIPSGWTVVSQ